MAAPGNQRPAKRMKAAQKPQADEAQRLAVLAAVEAVLAGRLAGDASDLASGSSSGQQSPALSAPVQQAQLAGNDATLHAVQQSVSMSAAASTLAAHNSRQSAAADSAASDSSATEPDGTSADVLSSISAISSDGAISDVEMPPPWSRLTKADFSSRLPATRKRNAPPAAAASLAPDAAAVLAAVDAVVGNMAVQDIVAGGEVEKVKQLRGQRRTRRLPPPVFHRTPVQAAAAARRAWKKADRRQRAAVRIGVPLPLPPLQPLPPSPQNVADAFGANCTWDDLRPTASDMNPDQPAMQPLQQLPAPGVQHLARLLQAAQHTAQMAASSGQQSAAVSRMPPPVSSAHSMHAGMPLDTRKAMQTPACGSVPLQLSQAPLHTLQSGHVGGQGAQSALPQQATALAARVGMAPQGLPASVGSVQQHWPAAVADHNEVASMQSRLPGPLQSSAQGAVQQEPGFQLPQPAALGFASAEGKSTQQPGTPAAGVSLAATSALAVHGVEAPSMQTSPHQLQPHNRAAAACARPHIPAPQLWDILSACGHVPSLQDVASSPLMLTALQRFAECNAHLMSLLWPNCDWRALLDTTAPLPGDGSSSSSGVAFPGSASTRALPVQQPACKLPPEPKGLTAEHIEMLKRYRTSGPAVTSTCGTGPGGSKG